MYDVASKYVREPGSINSAAQPLRRIPDTPSEMIFVEAGMPIQSQTQMHFQYAKLGNMGVEFNGFGGPCGGHESWC